MADQNSKQGNNSEERSKEKDKPDLEVDNLHFQEVDEDEEDQSAWKFWLLTSLRTFVGFIVILGMFYIYGGVREYLKIRETPSSVSQPEVEKKVEGELLRVPLNVFLIRNDRNGTDRNRSEVWKLVGEASEVFDQANIDLDTSSVRDVEVSNDEISKLQDKPLNFLRNLDGYKPNQINVLLLDRLVGINGKALRGENVVLVADQVSGFDFRVLAHEVGHILGLDHVRNEGDRLMNKTGNGYELTDKEIQTLRGGARDFKAQNQKSATST